MFAIYNLAITPMSSDDCQASFGETRDTLLTRYRGATIRALIAADFLTTKELEVLQALVLFLFAGLESELTCTMTAAAIRLGQMMGLHQENDGPKISFFEKEMRIRLWWQLRCLDSRSRATSIPGMKLLLPLEFDGIRLPLNVNDADLHPDMAEPPVENDSPTEMLCVLMKFEVLNWLRSSVKINKVWGNVIQGPLRGNTVMKFEDETIGELETLLHEKYLRNCDKKIPLHSLTHAVAKFTVSRMRFNLHHPRGRTSGSGGEVYMTLEESDMLFESALTALEMVDVSLKGNLSSHLFIHMTFTYQLDAYIYIISDLRRRCSGERVALAWRLVEDLYIEHPELIDDTDNTFFVAIRNLTLEAWEARRKALVHDHDTPKSKVTPQFVRLLWDQRESEIEGQIQIPTILDPQSLSGFISMDDADFNLEYWNDFLRI
jgi:hypothetical protein